METKKRYYCNKTSNNDNSFHGVANNRVFFAIKGMDIYQAKALDGKSLFSMKCNDDKKIECESFRYDYQNIWNYKITANNKQKGEMIEFITETGAFVRDFNLTFSIKFEIEFDSSLQRLKDDIYVLPKGVYYVNNYPTNDDVYVRFCGRDVIFDFKKNTASVTIMPNSRLMIILSKDINNLRNTDCSSYNYLGFKCVRSEIQRIEEDYFYLSRSFMSESGGYLACIEWNLNYIRDNYGLSRGLIATKRYDEARGLLMFYKKKFEEFGEIHTAYSVGSDKNLHIHENDKSENTGYLILQVFDYVKATNDSQIINEMMPLMRKAFWDATTLLFGGMMPFSGDETYVAGNMLPRPVVDNGSAEETLLFIESGKRLLPYLPKDEQDRAQKFIDEAQSLFKDNFYIDGKIYANNPKRLELAKLDETRKGVCPYCYYYGIIKLNKYKLYECPNCEGKGVDIRVNDRYYLTCVSMTPMYIGSDIFSKEELLPIFENYARELIDLYDNNSGTSKKIAGYEYGMVLYGLVKLESKYMDKIYNIVLEARDGESSWSEYYVGKQNTGMRWRLWENSINIMGLEAYWEYKDKN